MAREIPHHNIFASPGLPEPSSLAADFKTAAYEAALDAALEACERRERLRDRIAAKHGLTDAARERLYGVTESEISAHAEKLARTPSNLARFNPATTHTNGEAFAQFIEQRLHTRGLDDL